MASSVTSMATLASDICTQIGSIFSRTSSRPSVLDVMVDEITITATAKGRVFLHGVGREGLMLKALCMGLAHLGLSAHCVGDVNAPPISSSSDLLIASPPLTPSAASPDPAVPACSCSPPSPTPDPLPSLPRRSGTFRRRPWPMTEARRWSLALCCRWGACTKGRCSCCLRWWFSDWARFWERAPRPFDHAIPILNEPPFGYVP